MCLNHLQQLLTIHFHSLHGGFDLGDLLPLLVEAVLQPGTGGYWEGQPVVILHMSGKISNETWQWEK